MSDEKMARRSFFFDDLLYERLRQHATEQSTTMSEIVREAVADKIQPKGTHGTP